MPHVKFTGDYGAFITGRDVDSAVRYEDASDPTCVGIVPAVRAGDEEIEQPEYDTLKATIIAYNATIPPPDPPPPSAVDSTSATEAAAMPAHRNAKLEAVRAILAKADADITPAEVKTLVLIISRFLFKKFLSGWR